SKYVFILPLCFFLLLIMIILLKKRKKPLQRLVFYLNTLLILLIAIDVTGLVRKSIAGKKETGSLPKEFVACAGCPKPDVYIIVADEYAGNKELKDVFNFDDSSFLNQLAGRS